MNVDDVIDLAVEGYSRELGKGAHVVKTALRHRRPLVNSDNGLVGALHQFWVDPEQGRAVTTPEVLQSASHLFCNRLGMGRQEEFAAMWLIKTERNRRERRIGQA